MNSRLPILNVKKNTLKTTCGVHVYMYKIKYLKGKKTPDY